MDAHDERTQVARLKLQRLDVCELIASDELLSRAALIARLPADGTRSLLGAAQLKRYPQGARVFEEGKAGDHVYLVTRGEAQLAVGENASVHVATVNKGEHFGEEMLWGGLHAFTAIALTELEVAEIPRAQLQDTARTHRTLVDELARTAADRKKAREELDAFVNRW